MAKKGNRDDAPNPNSVPNRDIIQRLNFLYQASTYLNGLGAACASAKEGHREDPSVVLRHGKRKATVYDLARSYVKTMKVVGQKTLVKMDPTVKRTLCKGCNTLLMPGSTARVRVKPLPSHGHAVIYKCMNCQTFRRIPAPPTFNGMPQSIPPSADKGPTVSSAPASQKATEVEPIAREIDTLLGSGSSETAEGLSKEVPKPQRRNRGKKPIKPRSPPFFERKEHVLYVGDVRIDKS